MGKKLFKKFKKFGFLRAQLSKRQQSLWGEKSKIVELQDAEFVSPHEYLKNTSTNGTILRENLLYISKRLQTPKRARQIPSQQGRKKKEKKKRGIKRGSSNPGRKLDDEEEEPEIKLPTSIGSSKKQESSRKTSTSALLTMPKPLTV